MKTIRLALGPGALRAPNGSPFAIPLAQWQSINSYLQNVATTNATTRANTTALVPAFAALAAGADRWKLATLPNLVRVARDIDTFGSSTIAAQFPILQRLLEPMQRQVPSGSLGPFQDLMTQILGAARQNAELASSVVGDLQALDTAMLVVKRQAEDAISDSLSMSGAPGGGDAGLDALASLAQSMSQLASLLSAVGTPPRADIERIRGGWAGISDDLASFQSTVSAAIAATMPFIAELNLDVARSEWSGLAAEARQFAQQLSSL